MNGQPAANSSAASASQDVAGDRMGKLVLELVRPYHAWLLIVFVAMLVETAMSMAAPWPLKEGVSGLRMMHDVGIKVHTLKHLKLHAKMLLADGEPAIVGSINLAPGSFATRRELAIKVHDKHVVKRLQKIADHDWEHSHPLDLSDEGLLSDLEKRNEASEGAQTLVLEGHHKKNHDKEGH